MLEGAHCDCRFCIFTLPTSHRSMSGPEAIRPIPLSHSMLQNQFQPKQVMSLQDPHRQHSSRSKVCAVALTITELIIIIVPVLPKYRVDRIPEAADDFIRNYLLRLKLTRTLDTFQVPMQRIPHSRILTGLD